MLQSRLLNREFETQGDIPREKFCWKPKRAIPLASAPNVRSSRIFVPEGLNESSQVRSAWEDRQEGPVPEGQDDCV
jgi:hypothetical protein